MGFIIFSVIDFSFSAVLGVFDYINYNTQANNHEVLDVPDESRPLSLGVTAISGLCLGLVMPVFLMQVRSIFRKEAAGRESCRRTAVPRESEGTIMMEKSDASSMFLRPSDDWNPHSVLKMASFLTPKSLIRKKSEGCC